MAPPACNDLQDIISWTSPSGLARGLYLNPDWNDGFMGALSRIWLTALLLVPCGIALAEVVLGVMYRHSPPNCAYPLPLWVLVDGGAALLVVMLSLIDISRVQAAQRRELKSLAEDDVASEAESRERRSELLGSYACMGFLVIVLIPMLRLIWLLYGVDILYRIDAKAFGAWKLPVETDAAGCNLQLFSFMYYYIEAVALLLLLLLFAAFISVGAAISLLVCGNAREKSRRVGQPALPHEKMPLMTRKLSEADRP